MTVNEFLQNYGGNECVSIEGYCEEEHYDYPNVSYIPIAKARGFTTHLDNILPLLRLTANLINEFLHICNTNITPHFWGVNLVVPSRPHTPFYIPPYQHIHDMYQYQQ